MEKSKVFFACMFVVINFFACSFGSKHNLSVTNNNVIHSDYVKDTINGYGTKIKIFGKDSIYSYYSNGNISHIAYFIDDYPIAEKSFYENGIVSSVDYHVQYSKDSLYRESFYPISGKLSIAIWLKDTVIVTDGNPIKCHEFYTAYHENGNIKTFGYQGFVDGQGMSVGIHSNYDSLGYLSKTENYIYPVKKQPYIIITEYYNNGKRKTEKIYVNHAIHESDKEEPIGTWKYYDENGKLLNTEKY